MAPLRRPGAQAYAVASASQLAFVAELDDEPSLATIVARYFPSYDVVVCEGYRHETPWVVEVFRRRGERGSAPGRLRLARAGQRRRRAPPATASRRTTRRAGGLSWTASAFRVRAGDEARAQAPAGRPRRVLLAAAALFCWDRLRLAGPAGDTVTLHVLAAASLNEAFTATGRRLRRGPPGHEGDRSSSPAARTSWRRSARARPADVIATADTPRWTHSPSRSRPAGLRHQRTRDRRRSREPARHDRDAVVRRSRCQGRPRRARVPVGKYAQEILAHAGVRLMPVSLRRACRACWPRRPRRGRRRHRVHHRRRAAGTR